MIVLIDNYDSFVFNLARYLEELGESTLVIRNDAATVDEVLQMSPSHLILSPGPCTPAEAGICVELARSASSRVPVLGVCLGHQCLAEAFGSRVVRGQPVHGKVSAARHEGEDLFTGLPDPLQVTRYHALVVDPDSLTDGLETLAWTEDGTIMAIRHRTRPAWGVQFHPEACLTEAGHALLANFLALGRGRSPVGRVSKPGSCERPPTGVRPPRD
ncbi:MAG: aminodeoxychorismate/anthranilate synthase component II [marine benthic group bacterium]|nr:aminodeoxychorismate/anthranilate synthase component II [Candidatus Carthagonibacter metallireducens]